MANQGDAIDAVITPTDPDDVDISEELQFHMNINSDSDNAQKGTGRQVNEPVNMHCVEDATPTDIRSIEFDLPANNDLKKMDDIPLHTLNSAPVRQLSTTTSATGRSTPSSYPKSLSRQKSIRDRGMELSRSMKSSIADFFGVGDIDPKQQMKWTNRSVRMARSSTVSGKVKPELGRSSTFDSVDGTLSGTGTPVIPLSASFRGTQVIDPYALPKRQDSHKAAYGRQISTASSKRSIRPGASYRVRRKNSVARMAFDGIRSTMHSSNHTRKPTHQSRSITPASMASFGPLDYNDFGDAPRSPTVDSVFTDESLQDDVFFSLPTPQPTSPYLSSSHGMSTMPRISEDRGLSTSASGDHLATPPNLTIQIPRRERVSPSVLRRPRSKTHSPKSLRFTEDNSVFQFKTEEPNVVKLKYPFPRMKTEPVDIHPPPVYPRHGDGWHRGKTYPSPSPRTLDTGSMDDMDGLSVSQPHRNAFFRQDAVDRTSESSGIYPLTPEVKDSAEPGLDDIKIVDVSFWNKITKAFSDNSNRREVGKNAMRYLTQLSYRDDRIDTEIQQQMDDLDDHRPFFTYWVTFVQIAVYIIAIAVYGLAPLGFEETEQNGEVLTTNLAIEGAAYFEKDNLWLGPRQADLIHMGAKYSPCMRKDANIEKGLEYDRKKENQTACCVRNDGSGCVQSQEKDCSVTLSSWVKWTVDNPGPDGRVSGSVCGQDPRWCRHPYSRDEFTWADDITKWPLCYNSKDPRGVLDSDHMTCENIGRPCCSGIQGECFITTRQDCEFRRGYFHEEATLCSQVNCLNEICGMIPFNNPDIPDQFYRLWISLFLHAGLVQLLITVLFQFFIMRDLEKLAGWLRISIIYLGSGIAGSLSSAIFLPYYVEAGPAGSQFGLLACMFVEIIQNAQILKTPIWALVRLGSILFFLFVIGLLPMVDNYAHLIGFVFGLLLSFALLPYVTFGSFDKRRKLVLVIISLLLACGLFSVLVVLFYIAPIYSCPHCKWFNCLPLTEKFCESMEIEVRRDEF